MTFINIECAPYVAQYLKKMYHVVDGAVLLPQYTLAWYTIVNCAQRRPPEEKPVVGTLTVAFKDEAVRYKDLRYNNWIGRKRLKYISNLLRLDFDMNLMEFMEREHYKQGVDYDTAARMFHRMYELGDTVTEEALLKKHIRWKKKRREFRLEAEQIDLSL